MDIALNIGLVIVGLAGLYFGAEWLVLGATRIALAVGLSTLVVGLTVVAFGTSMPELIVSVQANLKGNGDFALGNIIGSNICNLGLVLAVAAIMTPLAVQPQVIRRELPLLAVVTIAFVIMLLADWQIGRIEGLILSLGIIAYTTISIVIARRSPEQPHSEVEALEDSEQSGNRLPLNFGIIIGGLTTLAIGSNCLVTGGEFLATKMGVSQAVIALTLVAFGTSLPELATTVVACLKGESDLAAGNAIGSCLFNLLCVGGFTASINPIVATSISIVDLLVLTSFPVAIFLMGKWKSKISRPSGVLMLVGYLAYIVFLGLRG